MRDSDDWNGERVALEQSSMRTVTVLKNTLFVSGVGGVEGAGVQRWRVVGEGTQAC